MQTKSIFMKLANNEPLSVEEKNELGKFSDRVDALEAMYGGMFVGGTSHLSLDTPDIHDPYFVNGALGSLFFGRNTAQSIPSATNTYITFEEAQDKNFGRYFSMNADHQRIMIEQNSDRPFSLMGTVTWATNNNGWRAAWMVVFDANDGELGALPLHTFDGNALVDNVIPISLKQWFPADSGIESFRIRVHQTTAGNLNLSDCTMGVSLA
jgi:hypothetical protein